MSDIIMEMKNIIKDFPGVRALDGVNFNVVKAEIHALVGENGAGKSTLMKILSGVHTEYEGDIYFHGKKVKFRGTKDAEEAGIAIIYQELNLISGLSVAENIFLGSEPVMYGALMDYKKMYKETRKLLSRFQLDVDPDEMIKNLPIGKQQMIEIVKAISKNAEILIFDEPTSALTDNETEYLFEIIDSLIKDEVTVIYISHRMEELFRISDRITVLRDGATVGTWKKKDLNHDSLVKQMVGRDITEIYPKIENKPGEVVLKVENYSVNHPLRAGEKIVRNVNFELRKGEILGIAGLMGSGRTELVESIFGAFPADSNGDIYLYGKKENITSPHYAIDKGMGLVTEDRKRLGLILMLSVAKNMTLSLLDRIKNVFFIQEKKEKEIVRKYIDYLRIKTPNEDFIVNHLSGGNQQKVILGKWLSVEPEILILDEPTRGIDIGAKSEIYNIIKKLSEEGISIIMVSSELPEVLKLSNRIIIMHEGKMQAIIPAGDATQEKIMHFATGGN